MPGCVDAQESSGGISGRVRPKKSRVTETQCGTRTRMSVQSEPGEPK